MDEKSRAQHRTYLETARQHAKVRLQQAEREYAQAEGNLKIAQMMLVACDHAIRGIQ
jgi:hypothetical protein